MVKKRNLLSLWTWVHLPSLVRLNSPLGLARLSGLAALVDKILQVRDLNKDRCFRLAKVHYNSSYKYHKATEVI
jgi:hypothetical protein